MSTSKQSISLLRLLAFFFFIGACAASYSIYSELSGTQSDATVTGHAPGRVLLVRDSSGNEYGAKVPCPWRTCGYDISDIDHIEIGSSVQTVSMSDGTVYKGSKASLIGPDLILLTFYVVSCVTLIRKTLSKKQAGFTKPKATAPKQ